MKPTRKHSFLLIGLSAGFMLLFLHIILWLIACYRQNIAFSFDSIIFLHQQNILYYIAELFSLLALFTVLFYGRRSINTIRLLNEKIVSQEESMNKVKIFSEKIGQNQLETEYELTNGMDGIGEALIKMRDNLREKSHEEMTRQETMNGVTKLGEILMGNSQISDLSYNVLVFLVHKINAIQGAFYLAEEDVKVKKMKLVMCACYAYNRKKYLNKEFQIGEGLVGQAAIERDYIYRTEIPDNYVSITSGILGDKKPNCLLVVPLIANDTLHGVIEIASLNPIKQIHINFVRETSKTIAQTIFNQSVNIKTSRLLEEVNHSQKRTQSLLENASEIISIYDENRQVKYESPSVLKILGYTPDEMIGDTNFSRIHPKGLATITKLFDDLLAEPEKIRKVQFSYNKKNGERIWLETTGRNMLTDPAIQGIILNSRDITMRRKAAKEEKMRGQMQSLSENSLDLIIRVSTDGIFYYINPVIELFTGKEASYFIKKNISEVELEVEFSKLILEIISKVPVSKQKYNTETEYLIGDTKKILDVNAIPEFNEENKVVSILIVAHDITEAKLNEQKIQEASKKITESINYAQRIQKAIIPDEHILQKYFPDSFILYKPRDVVSGDFPWILKKEDDIYVAAVDCTGHGVPGALVSLIGYFLLNEIVNQKNNMEPDKILNILNKNVRLTLKQDNGSSKSKDGMDIGLCKINLKKKELQYAGAFRPLFGIFDGKFCEIDGDQFPIGGILLDENYNYTLHTQQIHEGDSIFLFSDGLTDQFGGSTNKKFKPNQLRQLISENHHLHFDLLKNVIDKQWSDWKGNRKQTDDVVLIGMKFNYK